MFYLEILYNGKILTNKLLLCFEITYLLSNYDEFFLINKFNKNMLKMNKRFDKLK